VSADFTYVVARLRAIEARLPDNAWFQRLARTGPDSLLAVLREHFAGFESVEKPGEFDRALDLERTSYLDLISRIIPDCRYTGFIKLRYDIDNLIRAWKAKKLGVETALYPYGNVEIDTISGSVEHESLNDLPVHLRELVLLMEKSLERNQSLAESQYAAESEKWKLLLEAAPDADAKKYVVHGIDISNIRAFVRLKRVPMRKEALEDVWIEGGEIDKWRLKELMPEPEEEFYSYLKLTSYRNLVSLGLDGAAPLWKVQAVLERAILELMRESRYEFFSFAPVLYHIELYEHHLNILRTIIVGVLNRLPEDMVAAQVDAGLVS